MLALLLICEWPNPFIVVVVVVDTVLLIILHCDVIMSEVVIIILVITPFLHPGNTVRFILSSSQAEQELRMTQSEFDRQAEITRLLLEGVSSTHVCSPYHFWCLHLSSDSDVICHYASPGTPPTLLERLCGSPDYVLRTVLPVHGGSPEAAWQVKRRPIFKQNLQPTILIHPYCKTQLLVSVPDCCAAHFLLKSMPVSL